MEKHGEVGGEWRIKETIGREMLCGSYALWRIYAHGRSAWWEALDLQPPVDLMPDLGVKMAVHRGRELPRQQPERGSI